MSYDGQVNFGLTADYDEMGDLDSLAADLEASISELADAVAPASKSRRKAKRAAKAKAKANGSGESEAQASKTGAQSTP